MSLEVEERRESVTVEVGAEDRLDAYVARRLDISRTQAARLCVEGHVRVDGRTAKKSEPVSAGQRIDVVVPPAHPIELEPEDIPLSIVYEDDALLVIDKQPGIVVHPGAGHPSGTLANALLFHVSDLAGIGGALRPGLVHRLDRDTSGLMLVAKRDGAHQSLSAALAERRVRRAYIAATWGHLRTSPITVDAPLARDRRDRQRMAVVDGGKHAVTHARVREHWKAAELLDVVLETGRTHQIRVHLAHLGHPVVGDDVYGARWERGMGGAGHSWARELARRVPRQFLHAARLEFTHPDSLDEMSFESALPPDLAKAAEWARGTA